MATALDLITDALEILGVYSPGEAISAADSSRMLSNLNDMLDGWSNLTWSCYAYLTTSFTLVPGQQKYTIGSGGNINSARPLKIFDAPGTAYVLDFNGNNYPVDVVDQQQWNLYGNTSSLITSDFPDTLFYDPQFPLGIINVYPWPTIGYTMSFISYLQLGDFSSLATALSLPPGYKRAIT